MKNYLKYGLVISVLAVGFVAVISLYKHRYDYYLVERKSQSTADGVWKQLFNGKDFEGWELLLRDGLPEEFHKVYTIDVDSSLHFFRDIPNGHGVNIRKNGTHGVMATKRTFSRYHLKFEYKWGKKLVNNFVDLQYDSGVFTHIKNLKVFPDGIQYQIRYDHLNNINYSSNLRTGIGLQWYSANGKTFSLPSSGGVLKPMTINKWQVYETKEDTQFHGLDNKWNKCEIISMGKEYVIYKLNGEVVNLAINLLEGEGLIALEAETGEIYWRNIVIKEFEHSVPMVEFLCD